MAGIIRPLEAALVARLTDWLPNLTYPVRSGTHSQTAFALGLALDWARITGDEVFETLVVERATALYGNDQDCPIHYEPSGADFLSPCLGEADLMRRVMTPDVFANWLSQFLAIPEGGELAHSRDCHCQRPLRPTHCAPRRRELESCLDARRHCVGATTRRSAAKRDIVHRPARTERQESRGLALSITPVVTGWAVLLPT